VFLAEIGDVHRFPGPAQLASCAGLTPKHRESDTHVPVPGSRRRGMATVRPSAVATATGRTACVKRPVLAPFCVNARRALPAASRGRKPGFRQRVSAPNVGESQRRAASRCVINVAEALRTTWCALGRTSG
jgi:transposase